MARESGGSFYEQFGWDLIGAWETALRHDDEAFLLWSIPSWEQWGEAEACLRRGAAWAGRQRDAVTDFKRILLVDAPLGPLRIGRQPSRNDRDDSWAEE